MEVVKAFNNELSSLYEGKPPISKAKMTQVTRAAIKGLKFYKHIVQSVEKFIQKCRPEYKVPGLYVIDSIVRQSRHQFGNDRDVFVPRFSKNIVITFQHLYKCPVDERPRIVRVLNIWQKNNVFPTEVIQPLLDMANSENPSAGLSSSQSKSDPDDWKSWSASSQITDTINQSQGQKTDMLEDHVNDHDLHGSGGAGGGGGVSVLEGRGGGGVTLNSGIMSQLQELTSQLLNNNNNSMSDPSAPVPTAPVTPSAVAQSPVKSAIKDMKDENTVKFNKKLLDFDYGEEEEEDEGEEEEKEENGHAAPTEPTALALSMAQNLLSNPDLLRQLQQMQQTIQQTEAFNASLAESNTPQQQQAQQQPPPSSLQQSQHDTSSLSSGTLPHHMPAPQHHALGSVEEPRSHLPPTQNSYGQPLASSRNSIPGQSHMPAIYSDITLPQSLPPMVSNQPTYPPPAAVISTPLYPPMNNVSMIPPPSTGMCPSPIQQSQSNMIVNVPLPPVAPQSEPDYSGQGSMLHSMSQGDMSPNSLLLQDRDERSVWAAHAKDEDERVIQAPSLPPPRKDKSRSRSRSPAKGSSSRSSNRSSSRRSSRRSRSRSPRRKRDSSRSPTSGGGSGRHSRRNDDSRSRSDNKRSSSQNDSYSSRDPEREREREKERERRHKGLPALRKGFMAVCSTTLWLGHVPKISSEVEINETFSEYGTVLSVDLIPPRGCAYVAMARRQDALRALQKLRNLKLQGSLIKMAWAPGKGVKGKEFKEFWDVEQGVAFIPHEKIDLNIDLDALQEGGALDLDSLPDKLKDLQKSKEVEVDGVSKDLPIELPPVAAQQIPTPQTSQPQPALQPQQQLQQLQQQQAVPVPQTTQPAVQQVAVSISDTEQQQAAILANAASGVAAVAAAAAAAAAAANQMNPSMVPPPATLQQQFNLPLSGMVPSQALMFPQMPLPLGVPPPNSMVLMPHNSLGAPGGQPMSVLNALAATSGLPPGANPPHPGGLGGTLGLVEAGDRASEEELSAALVSNAALMGGGFPPQMGGFPPGHFPPGGRPQMHPNHMMGGPQWPPNMAGPPGPGSFIRPPGAPLQQFGRLLPGPMPGSPQGMFNPAGPPNRGNMIPGFNPVGQPPPPPQQQQQPPPTQQAQTPTTQQTPPTPGSQVPAGPAVERKMSPTLLEQEYNRFVATKGVTNTPANRKSFTEGNTGTGTPGPVVGNPNLEPLGTRGAQPEPPGGPRMLGPGGNRGPPGPGPMGPVPGQDMGFRHPRPMMGFGNPRVGSPQAVGSGVMGMNRFPFPGGRLQRPFMRGRGGMDFRGPRPGFGGDWGRPHHMGRDPFFEMERDFPMGRRDWDMEMDPEGMFPDRPWGGPHGEMDERFMGCARMEDDFGGPRPREDEFGGPRSRDEFGRGREDFGGPRKRDDFGRHRDDYGGPRNREDFGGPRNREDFGGPRSRENEQGAPRNRDEEFGGQRNRDDDFSGNRDGPDFENNRWERGHDSFTSRDNFDLRDERDSDRNRRRDRDRDTSRESDRDRTRDSERQRDRDSDREHNRDRNHDRDKDRERDRDRDRDSERKRGRERRERTRWNRSSSREKDPGAQADVETAPSASSESEQPMEMEPVAEPTIPDSVFKAPLPVLDIPAPPIKTGNNGTHHVEDESSSSSFSEERSSTGPEANNLEEDSVFPKENSFAFPEEEESNFSVVAEPSSFEPVNTDVPPAHDFPVENTFKSDPFEETAPVSPNASFENPVKSINSVEPEFDVEKSVPEQVGQEEPSNNTMVEEECPQ